MADPITPAPAAPAVAAPAPAVTPAPATPVPDVKAPASAAAPAAPSTPDPSAPAPDKKAAPEAKTGTLLGDDPDDVVKPEGGEPKPLDDKNKPAEPAPGDAPKYDVKVPEGMVMDQPLMDAVTPIFQKHKLSNDVVQELVNAYAPHVQQMVTKSAETAIKVFDDKIAAEKSETLKMLGPEPGKAMAPAARLIKQFAGSKEEAQAFRALLVERGIANHPLMVKFMINAGKAISQDHFPDGDNPPSSESQEAKVNKRYPSMK